VRHVPGWLRYRMSLWLSPAGIPVASPSQLRASERDRILAEQSARAHARQEAAERRVDVAALAAQARAMLAQRTRARPTDSVPPDSVGSAP
jgi:hypothetical protein